MSELTRVHCELHWQDGRDEVVYYYATKEVDALIAILRQQLDDTKGSGADQAAYLNEQLAQLRQQLEEDEHLLDWIYEAADGLPQDGEKVPGGRKWVSLPAQLTKLRQRVEELEHENKNLMVCQCENCDNSLEEEAVCGNCYRKLLALLDNAKENVKSCHTVLNKKDKQLAQVTEERDGQFTYAAELLVENQRYVAQLAKYHIACAAVLQLHKGERPGEWEDHAGIWVCDTEELFLRLTAQLAQVTYRLNVAEPELTACRARADYVEQQLVERDAELARLKTAPP